MYHPIKWAAQDANGTQVCNYGVQEAPVMLSQKVNMVIQIMHHCKLSEYIYYQMLIYFTNNICALTNIGSHQVI